MDAERQPVNYQHALSVLRQMEEQYSAVRHLAAALATFVTLEADLSRIEKRVTHATKRAEDAEHRATERAATAEQAAEARLNALAVRQAAAEAKAAQAEEHTAAILRDGKATLATMQNEQRQIIATHVAAVQVLEQQAQSLRKEVGRLTQEWEDIKSRAAALR